MGLPGIEDSLTIGWAVSTQYQRVTTNRQTDVQLISITCAVWLSHVKNLTTISASTIWLRYMCVLLFIKKSYNFPLSLINAQPLVTAVLLSLEKSWSSGQVWLPGHIHVRKVNHTLTELQFSTVTFSHCLFSTWTITVISAWVWRYLQVLGQWSEGLQDCL